VPVDLYREFLRYLEYLKDLHYNRNKRNVCPSSPPTLGTKDVDGETFRKLPLDNKFRGDHGHECVYNDDGTPKTDEGSYNYGPDPISAAHVFKDILPDKILGHENKGLTTYAPPP
jgi:hypothetical protein